MKKELLTVKELAAELRMSVKSIQRAPSKRGNLRAAAESYLGLDIGGMH